MLRIHASLAGDEVAKWMARKNPDPRKIELPPTLIIVGSSIPVFRDSDDPLGLPYLGDAQIELIVRPQVRILERLDMDRIAEVAVRELAMSGAPIRQASKLMLEIER